MPDNELDNMPRSCGHSSRFRYTPLRPAKRGRIFRGTMTRMRSRLSNGWPWLGTPTGWLWLVGLPGIVVGSWLTPPFQGCDELRHLGRVYTLLEGQWALQDTPAGPGGYLPAAYVSAAAHLGDSLFFRPTQRVNQAALAASFSCATDTQEVAVAYPGATVYPPFVYLPQLLSTALGRAWQLPVGWVVLLGRWAGAIAWLLLVGYGLRRAAGWALPLLLLALLPMHLFQAGVFSADAVTYGLAFAFLGVVLGRTTQQAPTPLTKRQLIIWTLIGAALAASKLIYVLLLPLWLFVPREALSADANPLTKKTYGKRLAVLLGLPVLGALVWALVAASVYQPDPSARGELVGIAPQLRWMASHPVAFTGVLLESVVLQAKAMQEMWIGLLGCADTFLPYWAYPVAEISVLVLAVFGRTDTDERPLTPKVRGGWMTLALAGWLGVYVLLFLTFNPVGAEAILGMHGRYLIPFMPLLFFAFRLRRAYPELRLPLEVGAKSLGVVLVLLMWRALWVRYYS